MLKLLRLFVVLAAAAALALVVTPAANAEAPTRFVVTLSPDPACTQASGASGIAYLSVNEANGQIKYSVAAFNLPGDLTVTAAHIHRLDPAAIVVDMDPTGLNSGFVFTGSATDPALAAAIIANPANYYINVHTSPVCGGGAIRGSLG